MHPSLCYPLLALTLLASAPAAVAQTTQPPPLVPGLENFDLSGPRASPTAVPTPSATPSRVPLVQPTPTPIPTRAPLARATPVPAASRVARPGAIVAAPVPLPTPIATPPAVLTAPIGPDPETPTPRASPPAAAPASVGIPRGRAMRLGRPMIAAAVIVLAMLALGGYLWLRRRRRPDASFEIEIADRDGSDRDPDAAPGLPQRHDPPPAADAAPPAPFVIRDSAPAEQRARLELTVRPVRAGTNLTSAAVDYEIAIRNVGELDAVGILVDLRLFSASADQDAILTALYAAPIDKPVVAPFEVPAGAQVSLGGMAMLPREALSVMTVRARDFFVPLLSLNFIYGWGGEARGQTAGAYVIGIERPDEVKMAPFRLDTGPRMFDQVGARLHTLTVNR